MRPRAVNPQRPGWRAGLVLLALLGLGAGCSHYELGTSAKLPFTTLYVEPVGNDARIPQAQAAVSTQLRTTLEEDGRVTLVNSAAAADATLVVRLVDYHRQVAAVREQDTGLAGKFDLTLAASCTLRDNHTGKAYFSERRIEVNRDAFTDNGDPHSSLVGNQLQSEYNTVPLLAESLADQVAHAVLDVW